MASPPTHLKYLPLTAAHVSPNPTTLELFPMIILPRLRLSLPFVILVCHTLMPPLMLPRRIKYTGKYLELGLEKEREP